MGHFGRTRLRSNHPGSHPGRSATGAATACLALVVFIASTAHALSPSSFEAGVQISHITYKEPGFMKESGLMYGVTGAYTSIGKQAFWKIDGTLAIGTVDYTGAYQDGTPLTISNIKDQLFETRAVLGSSDFIGLSSYYLPYIGLGYRYLFDGANIVPGGYRRESNYLYIPFGVEGFPGIGGEWRFGFTFEYDLFVQGKQCSYFSDIDPGLNDVQNGQSSGHGYRASLKFVRSGKQDIVIEPFYKYWKIGESDVQPITYYGTPTGFGAIEPANNSTELGVKCIVRF